MRADPDESLALLEARALALEVHPLPRTARSSAAELVRRRAYGGDDAERLLSILGLRADLFATPSGDPAQRHGTRRTVLDHRAARELLCPPCQAWFERRYQRTRIPAGASCGSEAGARRHERLCEPVCERCRAARNHIARARYRHQVSAVGAHLGSDGPRP